ncbi:transcription termination factor Rho [Gulosibacter molinativorax]|uniref:Transcription termination factor Rho n=1 Tax=Gulosibacter molinativorax TaxID=256821 RepID=A0ABT7C543_9MICO|nr:transcription termination factor Rho [Gulosibacter molinativorax]MDJ1369884.1 transcription termination factor Rho [Gulosibacter molinativorax]QUY61849.1 Transcription termination factor Rho [Gulosibacter molinativorax]
MNTTPEEAGTQPESGATESRPLSAMRVADLQRIAQELGIKGAARMRKTVLVEAIEAAQSGNTAQAPAAAPAEATKQEAPKSEVPAQEAPKQEAPAQEAPVQDAPKQEAPAQDAPKQDAPERPATRRNRPAQSRQQSAAEPEQDEAALAVADLLDQALDNVGADAGKQDEQQADRAARGQGQRGQSTRGGRNQRGGQQEAQSGDRQQAGEQQGGEQQTERQRAERAADAPRTLDDIILPPARDEGDDEDSSQDGRDGQQSGRKRSRNRNRGKGQQPEDQGQQKDEGGQPKQQPARAGEDQNGKQNQNQRQRDRKRSHRDDADPEIAPDDVLLPIAGILDVLDNYAFVRTSGYLAGVNDVYVSLGQVKKYGLRKGDAIVGAIRQPREGEHHGGRQKYNALVRVDTINGETPDSNRERPEFDNLTPLYPNERIELETENGHAAQRMIDLFAPIGKGTRGLIIAPPKSGKSIILERIANAIAQNSPDTHLMLVLVDERPEEVTRLERTIHGEVVASTFDMPAENHTTIAELAIERAKRLVELGLDVVVLLDSITQLCRAYNLTAPASGRIIAGGVDASALYPPKRFFGAARKVENGGSLTILATAMVETGSRTDEVILEEFAGTGNMELRLSREIADKRIFPALDIQQSSTLHEEELLSPNELEVTWAIRRALHGDAQASLEAVLERISSTSSNEEFLASVRANPISTVSAQ